MSNIPPYESLDPRVQRTMDILFNTFVEKLKEKHFRHIKVQEITQTAKINRSTFYNHFSNINEFILFCAREGFRRELVEKFPKGAYICNKNNFKSVIEWVLKFISSEFYKWHFQWDEILFEKALRIEFYYFLDGWIQASEKPSDQVRFNYPALLISSSVIGLGMVWCENDCIDSIHDLSNTITEIYISGIVKN